MMDIPAFPPAPHAQAAASYTATLQVSASGVRNEMLRAGEMTHVTCILTSGC